MRVLLKLDELLPRPRVSSDFLAGLRIDVPIVTMRMPGHRRDFYIAANRVIDARFPRPMPMSSTVQQVVKANEGTDELAVAHPVLGPTRRSEHGVCVHVPDGFCVGEKKVGLTLPHLMPVERFVRPVGSVEQKDAVMLADFAELVAMTGGNKTRDRVKTPTRELGKARGAEPEPVKVSGVGIPEQGRFQKVADPGGFEPPSRVYQTLVLT